MSNVTNNSTPPSKMKAFVEGRCPRCRAGKCFKNSAFSTKFGAMHDRCQHCGFKFEIEPGFFWGSMYISYGFLVAEAVTVGFAMFLMFQPSLVWYAGVIVALAILLMPVNYRASRLAMVHFFGQVDFVPEYYEKGVPKSEWKDEGRAVDNVEELMQRPQHTINRD